MDTDPPFDLKEEIDLIFATGKALNQARGILDARPWLGEAGYNLGNEKDVARFIGKAIKASAEKALTDLDDA